MKAFRSPPVLGVFGGSFDPPHLGHAMLPTYLRLRGLVDRVLVAPCVDHPFGKAMRPFDDRLAWTRIAMAPHGDFVEVSAIESTLAEAEPGPSYTFRLLEHVQQAHPHMRVRLVIGSDIARSDETSRWHRWTDIERLFEPIVVPRAGYAPPAQCVLPEVSSTAVRDAIAAGDWSSLEAWVPEPVLARLRDGDQGRVWIVGQGNVAAHAGPWLRGRGWRVDRLPGRDLAAAHLEAAGRPDAVWILVRDAAIGDVARVLADWGGLPPATPVFHGAGASRAADVLAPLAAAGHPVGTLHPICSLRQRRVWPSHLARAGFGVEAPPSAMAIARRWLQGQPVVDLSALDDAGRRAYHGACALAANHWSVLLDASSRVLIEQGHPADVVDASLAVLLESSLSNLVALGIPEGITGPAVRGDEETIRRHLAALPEPARSLYAELSARLVRLISEARAGRPAR